MSEREPKVILPFTFYQVPDSTLQYKGEIGTRVTEACAKILNQFLSEMDLNTHRIHPADIDIIWISNKLPELKLQIHFFDFPETLVKEVDEMRFDKIEKIESKMIRDIIELLTPYFDWC